MFHYSDTGVYLALLLFSPTALQLAVVATGTTPMVHGRVTKTAFPIVQPLNVSMTPLRRIKQRFKVLVTARPGALTL